MPCLCCTGPNLDIATLLQLQAIPAPFVPPPAQPGITYRAATVPTVMPKIEALTGSLKLHPAASYWHATLARATYSSDAAWATRAANALKPPLSVTFQANNDALTPGYVLVRYTDGLLVVLSGTTNQRQAMNYVLTHANDRQGGLTWTVNKAWWDAAQALMPVVTPLIPHSNFPVLCVGHSYGAPVAATIAALLPRQDALTVRGLVTFGSPAFGSTSFCNAADPGVHMRWKTAEDPYPFIPPPSLVGFALNAASPLFNISPGAYRHCDPALVLTGSNQLQIGDPTEQNAVTWGAQVVRFLSDIEGSFLAHSMGNYCNRIRALTSDEPGEYLAEWADWWSLTGLNKEMEQGGI